MSQIFFSSTSLNSASRLRALDRAVAERFDVLVIGAGVTGAGIALDAASRGLKTLLVDQLDIAAGTSRWSSKLVHGGLRYLATGQVAVAKESALERHHILTHIAPHLARRAPFLVPLDDATSPLMGLAGEAGIRAGDLLRVLARTPSATLPTPRRVSAPEARVYAPCLHVDSLRGAILYWDGQLNDDARFVTALARTAAGFGAQVITRAKATRISEREVDLVDTLTGEAFLVKSRVVINATGVWVGDLDSRISITPSRGSHLVVHAQTLGWPRAVFTAPVPGSLGRYLFAIPAPDSLVYLGLTDVVDPQADPIEPPCPPEDMDFILRTINLALHQPLSAADVLGSFAGLRPLLSAEGHSADISRRHLLIDEPGQALTMAGGKLTAYRQMAQDAVDAACHRLGVEARCHTRTLALIGAGSPASVEAASASTALQQRYGTQARMVEDLAQQFPEFAQRAGSDTEVIGAELLFGALHEGALDESDLLERRTRLSMVKSRADAAMPLARRALEVAKELV